MKRPYYLIFAISAFIVAGLFIMESYEIAPIQNNSTTIVLIVLSLIAVIVAILRLTAWKNKEPVEDEYTKKIMLKTSSYSFYISLYLWLLISYFSEGSAMDTQRIIGLGIVGMAIVFVISWVFVKLIGLRNE